MTSDKFESSEQPTIQEMLKKELLNQERAPTSFLEEIFKLDQSDKERSAAQNNREILEKEEVKSVFDSNAELSECYYTVLSLTYFHLAQQKGFKGDIPVDELNKSIEAARQADLPEEEMRYKQATLAYFSRDLEKLEEIYEATSTEDPFVGFITNLYKGLKERGDIDYGEDYRP
ncbi:MAG: hypothetical protein WD049_03010 [Candidatus Paceibacterota bacterium]